MPTFSLNTAFSEQDLQRLYTTGTNIVVAKPNAGGTPNVAWVVYRPLQANTMTWEENYGIYASNTEIQNGASLVQMSKTAYPAVDGKLYTLGPAGVFGPPSGGGTANSYTTFNDFNNLPKGSLTMGLYQNANVNGTELLGNAVSAAPVLYKSTAVMTPFTTVYLWTQSQVRSNTVVTTVTSEMTEVRLGGPITDVSLRYDASSGKFIPDGKLAKETKELVLHHSPSLV